jgi:hypothetical protein
MGPAGLVSRSWFLVSSFTMPNATGCWLSGNQKLETRNEKLFR